MRMTAYRLAGQAAADTSAGVHSSLHRIKPETGLPAQFRGGCRPVAGKDHEACHGPPPERQLSVPGAAGVLLLSLQTCNAMFSGTSSLLLRLQPD